jgi:hypothetical protein
MFEKKDAGRSWNTQRTEMIWRNCKRNLKEFFTAENMRSRATQNEFLIEY